MTVDRAKILSCVLPQGVLKHCARDGWSSPKTRLACGEPVSRPTNTEAKHSWGATHDKLGTQHMVSKMRPDQKRRIPLVQHQTEYNVQNPSSRVESLDSPPNSSFHLPSPNPPPRTKQTTPHTPNTTANMGCCCGLFKSKSKKNKKNSKHNPPNNSQFAAPRPVQQVVQNGRVNYQPTTGPASQYSGGGTSDRPTHTSQPTAYQQPGAYQQQPGAFQQQGEYDPRKAEYDTRYATNRAIAGSAAACELSPSLASSHPRIQKRSKGLFCCCHSANQRFVPFQTP